MQSYATAKPSVGLLPSMGGLCFYDREWQLPWVPGSRVTKEWQLPWVPGSRVTSVTYKCGSFRGCLGLV